MITLFETHDYEAFENSDGSVSFWLQSSDNTETLITVSTLEEAKIEIGY